MKCADAGTTRPIYSGGYKNVVLYLVVGAVPNVLQLLVVLGTETVRLEQVVEFAVVAAMEGDGDPGSEHRLAAGAAAQFRRGKRPQKSRQALQDAPE